MLGRAANKKKPDFHLLWRPKEDITTYELALCQTVIIQGLIPYGKAENYYSELPPNAQRHFEVTYI